MTVWVSAEAIAAWTPRRSGRRGGQRRYSDLAIETALTLRLVYHLPLRQAEGFLYALFGMMRLALSAPDYTTLSRRSQHVPRRLRLVPPGEGLHLVLDSTGLSIVGAGEWAAATHGGRGRRGWRKLHLGVDQSGVIRVHTLTEATSDDATTALDLLTAVEGQAHRQCRRMPVSWAGMSCMNRKAFARCRRAISTSVNSPSVKPGSLCPADRERRSNPASRKISRGNQHTSRRRSSHTSFEDVGHLQLLAEGDCQREQFVATFVDLGRVVAE